MVDFRIVGGGRSLARGTTVGYHLFPRVNWSLGTHDLSRVCCRPARLIRIEGLTRAIFSSDDPNWFTPKPRRVYMADTHDNDLFSGATCV